MYPQLPADGIARIGNFADSSLYNIDCSCGNPAHSVVVEVEAANNSVDVTTYVTVSTNYWWTFFEKRYDIDNALLQSADWLWKDIANAVLNRIRLTWNIWSNGYVETETTITMTPQQVINYAAILQQSAVDSNATTIQPST